MNVFISLFLSLTALFLISSCGLEGAAPPILGRYESPDPPAQFSFSEPACQTRRELNFGSNNRLSFLDLYLTDGTETKPTRSDLKNVILEKSLRSDLVKDTVYQTKYERVCGKLSDRSQSYVTGFRSECPDSDGYRAMVGGARVKVCRKALQLKRDTVESAALNSIHLLDKAHRYFNEMVERKITLPQILLEIFPEYGSIYKTYDDMGFETDPIKKYMYHNVLYWPRHNTISVMPESSTGYERMQLSSQPFYHLWESSFVLGHELGHHIQFTVADNIRYCPKAAWNAYAHEFVAMNDDDSPSSSTVPKKLAKICSGLSEAFADLFSHYSLEGSTRSYEANPLLYPARSAVNPKISNRTEKILTQGVMEMFLDKGFDSETARRSDVDFTDSHLVGAIFAYTFNRYFALIQNYSTQYEDSPSSTQPYQKKFLARGRWLMQFMKNFKNQEPPIVGPDSSYDLYLAPIQSAMQATLTEIIIQARVPIADREKVKSELCQMSKDLLPAMLPVFERSCM